MPAPSQAPPSCPPVTSLCPWADAVAPLPHPVPQRHGRPSAGLNHGAEPEGGPLPILVLSAACRGWEVGGGLSHQPCVSELRATPPQPCCCKLSPGSCAGGPIRSPTPDPHRDRAGGRPLWGTSISHTGRPRPRRPTTFSTEFCSVFDGCGLEAQGTEGREGRCPSSQPSVPPARLPSAPSQITRAAHHRPYGELRLAGSALPEGKRHLRSLFPEDPSGRPREEGSGYRATGSPGQPCRARGTGPLFPALICVWTNRPAQGGKDRGHAVQAP